MQANHFQSISKPMMITNRVSHVAGIVVLVFDFTITSIDFWVIIVNLKCASFQQWTSSDFMVMFRFQVLVMTMVMAMVIVIVTTATMIIVIIMFVVVMALRRIRGSHSHTD